MPQSDSNNPLPANFLALLNADNVAVIYTSNPYLIVLPQVQLVATVWRCVPVRPQDSGAYRRRRLHGRL